MRRTCCCSARCAWCARPCLDDAARRRRDPDVRRRRRSRSPSRTSGLSTVLRASVSALAKTLALELAASGIRVNQIIPGRIDTDRVRHLDEGNAKRQGVSVEEAKKRTRWRRFRSDDMADRRVRPCRCVSAVGRRVVHDRRDRAGGRRVDTKRAVVTAISQLPGVQLQSRSSSAELLGGTLRAEAAEAEVWKPEV